MADSAQVEGRNGGGSGKPPERRPNTTHARAAYSHAHARAYEYALVHTHARASVSLAVKGSGLLALLLSTVVLLGGFVSSLRKTDFFCVTVISMIQAAGIFKDWERSVEYLLSFVETYFLLVAKGTMFVLLLFCITMGETVVASHLLALEQLPEKWGEDAIGRYISDISAKCRKDPLSIKGRDLIKYGAELLDSESQEDYLYGARLLSAFIKKGEDVRWLLLPSTHRIQRLIDSLMISSSSSLDEARVQLKYQSRSGTCYAVIGSLDDKKEIRELAATIVADVAAHIDDLSKYPGAMRCISSLLQDQEETTQTYRNRNSKQVPDDPPQHQRPTGPLKKGEHYQEIVIREERPHIQLMRDQKRMKIREHRHRHKREGGTSNELVQQGLTILELLASNSDYNRRIICGAPELLPKITAPVYSATLIQDVKTKAWADIVTRCLKVLYQLIRAPGRPSRRMRRQIFSKHQALSNLKRILLELGNDEADHQELQLVAMEILTELALDLSTNLSEEIKEVLVTNQLQLFLLANGDGAAMVGRTLVSLSTNSESNSALIMTTQDGIIGRLTEILDDKKNVTQRTIAAEIMANLCAHCNVDSTMKEILLPKVLREIMSMTIKSQQRQISAGQNKPASRDEHIPQGSSSVSREDEERHNISRVLRLLTRCLGVPRQSPTSSLFAYWSQPNLTDHTRAFSSDNKLALAELISPETNQRTDSRIEDISDQEREEQEAFLSLAQVICDKLNGADLDGAIQIAFHNENNAGSVERRRRPREIFVYKLKTIIDDNRHATADSLRIVKLCGQIAESVMRCEQYVEIFRNKGFKSSLSEASKTMSELESCMLFVGTDFGLNKTVRPLFSEIEETWSEM